MLKMHFHLSRTHWPTFQPFPQYVPHYPRSIRDPPPHCSFSPGFLIPPKPLFLSRYCSYLCIFLPPFSDQLYHDYSFWRRGRSSSKRIHLSRELWRFVESNRNREEESSSIRRILSSPPFRSQDIKRGEASKRVKATSPEGYIREDPSCSRLDIFPFLYIDFNDSPLPNRGIDD